MTVSPPLARLRDATRPAHHRLDSHPLLAALSDGPPTPEAYRRALAHLHLALAPLEARLLAPGATRPAGFMLLPRAGDLAADVIASGGGLLAAPTTPDAALATALDHLDAHLEGGGLAAWLGAAYVVEGARLGGRTIARALAARDPALAVAASRFFASPGLDVGRRWTHFGQVVGQHLADDVAFATARDAALATFEVFLAGLATGTALPDGGA
ncbi:biliverdin-producing heme oxygenase [Roseospirillum parvum]|uniref:Heme oxygenase n=1 Tax=Roseospirillum parvum TaxID=83401 RepID=A0A1G8DNM2_9PROT|nr:biliverdin-producing heme oxygenase [Roseospirillum parvum]SDH59266.1 Heme oxygenase [Roseospirillum parvum]